MSGFTCPFCNHTMALNSSTFYESDIAFTTRSSLGYILDDLYNLKARIYKCPNCNKITSLADYAGKEMPKKTVPLFPVSLAKQFPNYVPK